MGGDLTLIVTIHRRVGLPLSHAGEGIVRADLVSRGVFYPVTFAPFRYPNVTFAQSETGT